MRTEHDWTALLDRQWQLLKRAERTLFIAQALGMSDEYEKESVELRAADYGYSVRRAPAVALLAHARNVKHVSPSM